MKLKFCSCRMCKWGRKSSWEQENIRQKKKSARRVVKELLRSGEYDNLPIAVAIGYTD